MAATTSSDLHMTSHAIERSQQRCIAPLIIHWLCQYGTRRQSRNGTMLYHFDRKSLRLIASDVGHRYKRIKNL